VETKVKEAAEISMGTEISEDDIQNIQHLCDQVSMSIYKTAGRHPVAGGNDLHADKPCMPICHYIWVRMSILQYLHYSSPFLGRREPFSLLLLIPTNIIVIDSIKIRFIML
jgi:hypothetical protein